MWILREARVLHSDVRCSIEGIFIGQIKGDGKTGNNDLSRPYLYPDQEDLITRKALEGGEPFPGYWIQSERRILDRMASSILNGREEFSKPSWLMDAGCGWGRLLPTFEGFFDRVLAVEPDEKRLEGARRMAERRKFVGKVTFVRSQIQELDWLEESIDVIVCSHIIQHVKRDLVPQILGNMDRLLRPGGRLFLTTSHSILGRDIFTVGRTEGEGVGFSLIEPEDFDGLAKGDTGKGLPVRFYTLQTLETLLENAGFDIVKTRVFQIVARLRLLGVIDRLVGRDRFVNSVPVLKERMGTNIYLEARKVQ
jgi:SAM-dependent methyltransferase